MQNTQNRQFETYQMFQKIAYLALLFQLKKKQKPNENSFFYRKRKRTMKKLSNENLTVPNLSIKSDPSIKRMSRQDLEHLISIPVSLSIEFFEIQIFDCLREDIIYSNNSTISNCTKKNSK